MKPTLSHAPANSPPHGPAHALSHAPAHSPAHALSRVLPRGVALSLSRVLPPGVALSLLGSAAAAAATAADTAPPPTPTHLEPLALGQLSSTPWSFSPGWFVLLGLGLPALVWLGLAWKRALDEDPHRLRRSGVRELRGLLARVRRSGPIPQPIHLHGWCRAAARTWGVQASAPTGPQLSHSLETLAGDRAWSSAWRQLWSDTERGLYGADGKPPSDWLERAATAAVKVQVPKRERWLPNRVAHWLPCVVALIAVGGWAGSVRADHAAAPTSAAEQKAAVVALHSHWNDWAAHYNIAAAQIIAGNWNFAVAHATSAFLLNPASAANRDNLRFAIQRAGTMDPTLRRLLYGAWFQQLPGWLSPAGWQRLALAASLLLAGGLTAVVVALYAPRYRKVTRSVGPALAAAGVALLIVSVSAFDAYGPLNRATAGILLEGVNVNPSPTELVPERETSPASAGEVVLPVASFLGWQQIEAGRNVTGWVRRNAVMPLYQAPRH